MPRPLTVPVTQRRTILAARYVFPVGVPPIADGQVTILGDRIESIGPRTGEADTIDLGNAAIVPGLVNPHTHLEFSDLTEPLGRVGEPFADWIRRVVEFRRQSPLDRPYAAPLGLAELTRTGTTAVGEIATADWSAVLFDAAPLDAVIFRELLGLSPARVDQNLAVAREHLARSGARWRPGLSPHAPYTVHPDLFRRAIDLAAAADAPVAFHLAESREELELLSRGDGPLVKLLGELGAWDASAIPYGTRPLDYLRVLAKVGRGLVIHGNYLSGDEIAYLAANADRLAVVYCPRTHERFGHADYPLESMLAAGVRIAIGTDSRASSPTLDLWSDLRLAAQRHPAVPRSTILELGTLRAAEALGLGDRAGRLAAGRPANLAIVSLPDRDAADAHELLFEPDQSPLATVYEGRSPSIASTNC